MTKSRMLAFLVLASCLILGCTKEKPSEPLAPDVPRDTIRVALLGDQTRNSLLTSISALTNGKIERLDGIQSLQFVAGNKNIRMESVLDENIRQHAKIASQADLVLLVENANDGPMPIHREHVLLARQTGVPETMMLFSNSDQIDDPELLELIELEMRELFNNYALQGDAAHCLFDHEKAKTSSKTKNYKGLQSLVDLLAQSSVKRTPPIDTKAAHSFSADVYALAKKEVFRDSMTITSGPITLIVEGNVFESEVLKTEGIAPGDTGQITFKTKEPLKASIGQRFLIVNENHIVAAGAIKEILD